MLQLDGSRRLVFQPKKRVPTSITRRLFDYAQFIPHATKVIDRVRVANSFIQTPMKQS